MTLKGIALVTDVELFHFSCICYSFVLSLKKSLEPISMQVVCPFLNRVFLVCSFFAVGMLKIVHVLKNSQASEEACRHSLLFCRLSLHPLTVSLP